jgi:hypothetical protein
MGAPSQAVRLAGLLAAFIPSGVPRPGSASSTAAFENGPAAAAVSFIAAGSGDKDVPATPSSASRGAKPCLQAAQ